MAAETSPVKRSNAAEKYKWDLSEIYPDSAAFVKDIARIRNELLPQFEKYRGKLKSAENIKLLLDLNGKTERALDKAFLYSKLSTDLNHTDSEAKGLYLQYDSLYSEYLSASSFISTEIMELSKEKLVGIINDPGMSLYQMRLENLLQQMEHILSAKEEELLSMTRELSGSSSNIFESLMYGDLKNAVIEDENGQEIELTFAQYNDILQSPNRELRKKAYEAYEGNIASYNNTLAAIYASHVKNDAFYAKVRKYGSSLQQSLTEDNIPKIIYDSLISTTEKNLETLQNYYALRKQILEYEKLYSYDLLVPLVKDYHMKIPYDQAVQIVREALRPLGKEYIEQYDQAIENRWIDVYPDNNKYTGYYCTFNYDYHPYILLNYDGSLWGLTGLAHEMGHALNFVYTADIQEYENFGAPIFTAEVASTLNELLVMDYLIKNAESDQEKIYLLDNYINTLEKTFFRQMKHAEFEQKAHEMAEANQPLTPQALNGLWLSLTKKYYGDTVDLENTDGFHWSLIPHFYYSFYVYKYATSNAAAYALVDNILTGDQEAINTYLEFLGAGTSDYPVEILKKAGIDMNSPEPIEKFIQYFGQLVDELETLLSNQGDAQAAAKTGLTYIVKPGDILWKIAEKYGMTWEELAEVNKLENPDLLIPGKELVIKK